MKHPGRMRRGAALDGWGRVRLGRALRSSFLALLFACIPLLAPAPASAQLLALQRDMGPPWARVRAEEGLEGAIDQIESLWPALPEEIASGLGLLEPAPVEIVLLSGETFRSWSKGLLPEWGAGYARWPHGPIAIDVSAASRGPKQLPDLLRHELSHVYLGQRLGEASGVPRWFVEGVAQAQAAEWRWTDNFSLMRGSMFGRLPSLQRISARFPVGSGGAGQAYALSLAAVSRLQRQLENKGGWRALIDGTERSGRFDLAMQELTGLTVQSWTEEFDQEVGGRYRWLGVLGQLGSVFGLMTLLFLLGVGRAQWRKRRRLAEMEAEEAAVDLQKLLKEVSRRPPPMPPRRPPDEDETR